VTARLIIEPRRSGHHLAYLVELVDGAARRGLDVMVAVGTDSSGDEIAERLRSAITGVDIPIVRVQVSVDGGKARWPLGRFVDAYRWWSFLARAYRAATAINRVEFVFVPYIDAALFAISVLGSPFGDTPFGGISMAQRFHLHRMGVTAVAQRASGIRKHLFFRLLSTKGLRQLYVIDDTLEGFVRLERANLSDKIRFLPDPSRPAQPSAKDEARDALRLARGVPLIVVYGSLDQRKGIATLLRWIAENKASPVQILLAGRVREEVLEILDTELARRLASEQRLTLLPRYIEEKEESLIFSAADAIWIAYDGVQSTSGVLVKAALYQKAVLYRDFGLIGRYAARYGCPVPPERLGLPALPDGVRLCSFSHDAARAALPNHSWANACDHIFGPGE
jgi:hypothetical protein